MPRRSKGPRLYFRAARHDAAGKRTHVGTWIIRDGSSEARTGLGVGASEKEKTAALTDYLTGKHTESVSVGSRDPSVILVDDVLAKYLRDVVPNHARPDETVQRIEALSFYWSGKYLSQVTGDTCREYASLAATPNAARRQLEDLRSAINHHRREGLHDKIVSVVLPPRAKAKELFFEREEAAAAIRAAWRFREVQKGVVTDRRSRQHVARFMVFARYMGSRSGVICAASIENKRPVDRPWCDLRHGIFYGLPEGQQANKKRRQRVRIPVPLLAHLRRWRRLGQRYVVEWNGGPVADIHKAHEAAIADAELDAKFTPHIWRHTVATWLMQGGADPWKTAAFLAMSVETLLQVYGHHRPDDSADVHNALAASERSANRHRTATDNSEQKVFSLHGELPETPVKSA